MKSKFEETIIGKSSQIRDVITKVRQIASSLSATTLIIGESGTGKELVARLIHNLSPVANQPFVDINCGAIPETLLESELFGYEKGAFTGAQMQKQGLFELANGGTIFLDEIGNTTASFQMKLLKIVEYKSFRRVGGAKEIHVSTRIVAATNIDLLEAVHEGKFREDLYYRLNVFEIDIPPLRDREEDVIVLAEHFIQHFNKAYGRNIRGLAPSAKEKLTNYSWPGNIRQLKNAIERVVLVENVEWLEEDHFTLDSVRYMPKKKIVPEKITAPKPSPNFNKIEIPDEGISLEKFERDIILSALDKANGNLSKAARLLKISRGKLRYRLERAEISPDEILTYKKEPAMAI
jgi:two-component system, NtrC family, response regulator AtoC